jgi:hypothetical protein
MAILKDYYNDQFDLTIPNSYWKIETGNGLMGDKTRLNIRMSCYKTKEMADNDEKRLDGFGFSFVPDLTSSENFITQAYTYAKTLDKFQGAVDVI